MTNHYFPCEHVLIKIEKTNRCGLIVFKPILKFLPPSNTFQVLLKVILRMLMLKLYSSVHLRDFLLFYVSYPSHIQTGLNYTCFKHTRHWSSESQSDFPEKIIKYISFFLNRKTCTFDSLMQNRATSSKMDWKKVLIIGRAILKLNVLLTFCNWINLKDWLAKTSPFIWAYWISQIPTLQFTPCEFSKTPSEVQHMN